MSAHWKNVQTVGILFVLLPISFSLIDSGTGGGILLSKIFFKVAFVLKIGQSCPQKHLTSSWMARTAAVTKFYELKTKTNPEQKPEKHIFHPVCSFQSGFGPFSKHQTNKCMTTQLFTQVWAHLICSSLAIPVRLKRQHSERNTVKSL